MKVIILNSCTIPGLGRGPINVPMEATLLDLKKFDILGIRYKIVEEDVNVSELKPVPVEPVVNEESEPEVEVSEEEPVPVEPVVNEESEPEVEVSEPKYTEESIAELTKKELQNILKENNIEYKYADTISVLKEKVLEIK